ncbi:hypothetical protein D3C77_497120 [compost metagenome]
MQRLAQAATAEKGRAQNVVGVHGRLPGVAETLRVEPFDADRHLVDVLTLRLGIKAVEQHALLHRRQRIQVLHLPRVKAELIQALLVEVGQRHVGRGQRATAGAAAMLDQFAQGLGIGIGQGLDRGLVEHLRTELPIHQ